MGKTIRGIILSMLGVLVGSGGVARAQATPAGLTIQKDVVVATQVGDKHCDQVTWTDANGKPRSVWLVRARGDHAPYVGGYIEKYTYYVDNTLKTGAAVNDGLEAYSGLGCAVNHHDNGASSSKTNSTGATTGFILEGANHAVWRFHSTYSGKGGTVGLTIDWTISNGRSDVLWSVSFDSTGQSGISWDSRGPYFQFDWDNTGTFYRDPISGIKWGDKYRFRTTTYSGLTSDWDYQTPNVIPYMSTYKAGAVGDLEAGVVQTQPWTQQDAGGYWWADTAWGKTSANMPLSSPAMPVKGMPVNWDCPFQLNAYEDYAGEKLAWGTNSGFVGSASYQRIGYTTPPTPGAPHQGYSTYILLNKYSQGLTDATIASMEAVQQTTLTASTGTVLTSGPRHLNLAGNATYQPAGWDHVYGAWSLTAGAGNATSFNVAVASGSLLRPLFVIGNYMAATPPATVTLGPTALTSGTDYSASVNATDHKLWLTLNRTLTGPTNAVGLSAAAAPPGPAPTPAPTPAPAPANDGGGGGGGKCGCGGAILEPGWPLLTGSLTLLGLLLTSLRDVPSSPFQSPPGPLRSGSASTG
ncbi:MAG TPA: hypothetical protein VE981_18640 [Planctomycetota bacterium]|nr:hypothetical protein [Planctomycetota bacterium]